MQASSTFGLRIAFRKTFTCSLSEILFPLMSQVYQTLKIAYRNEHYKCVLVNFRIFAVTHTLLETTFPSSGEKLRFLVIRSSPRPISTCQLNTLLHLHLRPITTLSTWGLTPFLDGKSHLEGGFALRCLQRLSRPNLATQLCHWHDN